MTTALPPDYATIFLSISTWIVTECKHNLEKLKQCLAEIQQVYEKTLDQDLAGTLSCTMSDVCICMNKVSNIHLIFTYFADVLVRDFRVHEDANVMSKLESHLQAAKMQADTQQILANVDTIWQKLLPGRANVMARTAGNQVVDSLNPHAACLQPMLQYFEKNLWVFLMYCLWAEHCCCYATASKSSIDEADTTLLKKLEKIVMFKENDKHLRRFALDPLLQSTIDDIRKAILFIQHEASRHVVLHNTIEHNGKNEVLYHVITEGRHLFFTMNCTWPIRIFDKCTSGMHRQSLAVKDEESEESEDMPEERHEDMPEERHEEMPEEMLANDLQGTKKTSPPYDDLLMQDENATNKHPLYNATFPHTNMHVHGQKHNKMRAMHKNDKLFR